MSSDENGNSTDTKLSDDNASKIKKLKKNKHKKSNKLEKDHKKKKSKHHKERKRSASSSSSSESATKHKKKKKSKSKSKKHKKLKKENSSDSEENNHDIESVVKQPCKSEDNEEIPGPSVPQEVEQKPKIIKPMTKEEWEKERSVTRRVTDPVTGRQRLIRGDGEVLEELVSKEMHKNINKQATLGDGNYFQSKLMQDKEKPTFKD